jgi:hypothetical protein
MFALVLQTFLAKKNIVKKFLISTLDKVIYVLYIKEQYFGGLKNLTSLYKIGRVEIS